MFLKLLWLYPLIRSLNVRISHSIDINNGSWIVFERDILKQLHWVQKFAMRKENPGGNRKCIIFYGLDWSTALNLFIDVDFTVRFP